MKKWITYCLTIAFICLSIYLLIERKDMLDNVNIKIIFVDEFTDEEYQSIKFCAIDQHNNYDLIDIKLEDNVEDIYSYVFELYNHKRNTLPPSHDVVSNTLLTLKSITREEDKLYIVLEDSNIAEEELMRTLFALNVTYKFLGIKEINIDINDNSYQLSN